MKILKATIVSLFALFPLLAQAQNIRLSCLVQNPCQYSQSGMGGTCMTGAKIYISQNGSALILEKTSRLSSPQKPDLTFEKIGMISTLNQNGLFIRDRTGDTWAQLKQLPRTSSHAQGLWQGQLTVDQDFPFAVLCSLF